MIVTVVNQDTATDLGSAEMALSELLDVVASKRSRPLCFEGAFYKVLDYTYNNVIDHKTLDTTEAGKLYVEVWT